MATTEGYGVPVTEETRRLYGYSHVLEAGKSVQLRVMDTDSTAAQQHGEISTYEWRVRQEDGATLLRCACVRTGFVWLGLATDSNQRMPLYNNNSGQDLGPVVTVRCTKPGIRVSISVTELDEKGNGAFVYRYMCDVRYTTCQIPKSSTKQSLDSDARVRHRHGRLQVCAAGDAQAHGGGEV